MNTEYLTIYSPSDEILRVVSCPRDHVMLQRDRLPPGQRMTMGKADGITQKVVDGKVVDKTPAEMVELKRKNPRLRFDDGK